jgi:hypothetical protein
MPIPALVCPMVFLAPKLHVASIHDLQTSMLLLASLLLREDGGPAIVGVPAAPCIQACVDIGHCFAGDIPGGGNGWL